MNGIRTGIRIATASVSTGFAMTVRGGLALKLTTLPLREDGAARLILIPDRNLGSSSEQKSCQTRRRTKAGCRPSRPTTKFGAIYAAGNPRFLLGISIKRQASPHRHREASALTGCGDPYPCPAPAHTAKGTKKRIATTALRSRNDGEWMVPALS